MKTITGILALLFAAIILIVVLSFDSIDWSLKTMSITVFSLFLGFVHCLSLTIAQKGLLQKILYGTFGLQLAFIYLLLANNLELKTLWNWQFSLAFLSICIGIISSSLRMNVSPLVFYLQYLVLAIIAFCLLGLGLTPLSIAVITVAFSLLCLMSAIMHLFVKTKTQSIYVPKA